LTLALATTFSAFAQTYPVRPIRLVAPFPPGGFSDVTARILAQRMGERLGQTMIVDNRPGGGTVIGTDLVAKSPPDGYTLLYAGGSTFVINPVLMKTLPYDPLKSFDAISVVCRTPLAILAHPSVRANSVTELVALVSAKPGQFSYGSFGTGTTAHFAGEMFVAATGVKMVHVPYKGSTPSLNDLIAGQIPLSFDTVVVATPQLRAGRIKVIAVTTRQRSPLLPDVPTVAESGYAGFHMDSWIGLNAAVGTPAAIRNRLEAEALKVLNTADVREKFAAIGVETVPAKGRDFVDLVKQETPRYSKIARDSNITLE
jgi:tripartite-type tricarboxylate transporter receptor subunit TctC